MIKYRIFIRFVQYILPIFLLAGYIHSAPPRDRGYLKKLPPGFKTDWVLTSKQIAKMQAKGTIRKAGQKAIGTAQTYKILVIRVDFPDAGYQMTKTQAQAEPFFSSLRGYYYENSYGLVTVTATITTRVVGGNAGASGAYRLSSISNYNNETEADLQTLITDASNAATVDYNFALYDQVMIYHAGTGQEESKTDADLWSLFYSFPYTVDGKAFVGFTVVPEKSPTATNSPLGTICHEYGHQLGLPDLYDATITRDSTCGTWSLMDYAYGFDNTGNNPPHLDPWSKNYLNWIDLSARNINSVTPGAKLGDTETSQTTGYYKIPVEVGTSNEYFIIEYRRPDSAKMNYDLTQPSTGVIIWHIDDTIAMNPARLEENSVNSGTPNYGVDLVEADGLDRLQDTTLPPAKIGDMWRAGNTFSDPLSNAFNGRSTGVAISNFVFSADGAAFSITKLAAASVLSLSKALNYPNPAGEGYPAKPGFLTTIVGQFTRPPKDMTLSIYNLPGELVKTAAGIACFTLNIRASADNKWVYEFDWDGKNNFNEDVAPGVYFYRIKADTEIKVGKLAIVR